MSDKARIPYKLDTAQPSAGIESYPHFEGNGIK